MRQAGSTFERVGVASDAGGGQRGGQRGGRRRQVERVLELAGHLGAKDAFLVRQVFECGLKVVDIARQAGCGRGKVYLQLRSALRRMRAPLFAFAVAQGDLFSPTVRRTAQLVICQGLSQKEAAARTCRSLHAVRQDLHTVRALARF